MSISQHPSTITLPATAAPGTTILDFLINTFPHVSPDEWAARLRAGKVTDDRGNPIAADTPCTPARRIRYYREVQDEPVIPFAETILFRNDEILVADKPHFLPVTPGGRFVNECLLNRLRASTGIAGLAPMHRLDRETAGLVLFSVNPKTRGLYHELFTRGEVEKTYTALAEVEHPPVEREWRIENRIERGEPRFRMRIVPGIANARSVIHLVEVSENRLQFRRSDRGEGRGAGMHPLQFRRSDRGEGRGAGMHRLRFRLHPITGKTHQLRLHMSSLGFGILNDRVYPALLPESEDVYEHPLQLIASKLRFRDPLTGADREFASESELQW